MVKLTLTTGGQVWVNPYRVTWVYPLAGNGGTSVETGETDNGVAVAESPERVVELLEEALGLIEDEAEEREVEV